MSPVKFFSRSALSTDCDACGGRVDMLQGGVCGDCRRILCFTHLYGSWFARLRAEVTGTTRCVACRSGQRPTPPPA